MMTIALIGSLLLCASALCAIAKRFGYPARTFYRLHVWLAGLGFVLVAIHSTASLTRPPALLLASLLGLMILGLWARTRGHRKMASTFGSKHSAFLPVSTSTQARLPALIEHKKELLSKIDSTADEAVFSLTPVHWLSHFRSAFAYRRAVREESRLLGSRQSVNPHQAHWRTVHQLLAIAFVGGLLIHVVLVLFFAGYVADGGDIYWWHIADWDI